MSVLLYRKKNSAGETILSEFTKNSLMKYDVALDADKSDDYYRLLVLDTETTGLDHAESTKVLEIGAIPIFIHKETFKIKSIHFGALIEELEEFKGEITDDVKEALNTNKINLDDLKGKKIDWSKVEEQINLADFVFAHNSLYDRYFVDRHTKNSGNAIWLCSKADIDWLSFGVYSTKQEMIALQHGFEYNAHRAKDDILALIGILLFNTDYTKQLILGGLSKEYDLVVMGNCYDVRELLKKKLGFVWDGDKKVWHKNNVREESIKEIRDKFKLIAEKSPKQISLKAIERDPKNRYKSDHG